MHLNKLRPDLIWRIIFHYHNIDKNIEGYEERTAFREKLFNHIKKDKKDDKDNINMNKIQETNEKNDE